MSRDPNGKTLYREKHVQGPGDSNGPAGSGGARRAARLRERGRGAAGRRGPRGSRGRSAGAGDHREASTPSGRGHEKAGAGVGVT